MEAAGTDSNMLVESGRLKLVFPRRRRRWRALRLRRRHLPGRAPQLRLGTSRAWQPTVNKLRSKVLLPNRSPFPKVTMVSAMSKLHSKAIADELDENLSAGSFFMEERI